MGMFYGHNQVKREPLSGLGYGLLYNWYAISNANFAPTGWKVPTLTEWNTLFTNVGGTSVAGTHLKESGTTHWNTPGGDNSSNFTALGGALRTIIIYIKNSIIGRYHTNMTSIC